MGWGSGTEFFDVAVDVALKHCYQIDGKVPDILYKSIVREVYTSDAFRWSDWDTQDESKHADMLLLIRLELGEVDEDDLVSE